ncbi:MAG: potassium channel family protein [Bacteroidales bacterium]
MDLVILAVGIGMVLFVMTDMLLTILHIDSDGPFTKFVLHSVWKAFMSITLLLPGQRRLILSFAGPFMIFLIFSLWIFIFTFGFSLIYWPYMHHFRAQDELGILGFWDALYYSGTTASVLGFGDITPLHNAFKIISFVQAGLGFAFLTGIVSYLINLTNGISERNNLSLHLWVETRSSINGTWAVADPLMYEKPEDFLDRLRKIREMIHYVHQKMRNYPILELYYRSRDPVYSPELIIHLSSQIAISSYIISSHNYYRRLRPAAVELGRAVIEMMRLIASAYLSSDLKHSLDNPSPEDIDYRALEKLQEELRNKIPFLSFEIREVNKQLMNLIFSTRIFLDRTDSLTRWTKDFSGSEAEYLDSSFNNTR